MKKLAALLLCVLMMCSAALAELQWPVSLTSSQASLRNYLDRVNLTLAQQQAGVIDMQYADVLRKDLADKHSNPEKAMTHSFEEDVIELQGTQPRAYFAYYPNQYGDGQHWLQMTLIFARPGSEGAGLSLAEATPAPAGDVEYEGFFSQDNYTHLEIFATPTPEPDSAAMEDW